MSALRPKTRVPVPQTFGPAWASDLTRWLDQWVQEMRGGEVEVGGKLITESGRIEHLRLVTDATDTARLDDEVIDVNRAGVVTVTLPPSANLIQGQKITIHDGGGNAGGNTITIAADGSDNINGGANVTITTNYGRRTCRWNGTEWVA